MMAETDLSETIKVIREEVINNIITAHIPPGSLDEQWDIKGLEIALDEEFGQKMPIAEWLEQDNMLDEAGLRKKILAIVIEEYDDKERMVGAEGMVVKRANAVSIVACFCQLLILGLAWPDLQQGIKASADNRYRDSSEKNPSAHIMYPAG